MTYDITVSTHLKHLFSPYTLISLVHASFLQLGMSPRNLPSIFIPQVLAESWLSLILKWPKALHCLPDKHWTGWLGTEGFLKRPLNSFLSPIPSPNIHLTFRSNQSIQVPPTMCPFPTPLLSPSDAFFSCLPVPLLQHCLLKSWLSFLNASAYISPLTTGKHSFCFQFMFSLFVLFLLLVMLPHDDLRSLLSCKLI